MNQPSTRPIAVIDIGSNSIHLTLARMRGDKIEILARLKDPARLAGELNRKSRLSPESIDRGVATLARFRHLADVQRAEMRATATATLRAARNADEFVQRARDEAGVEIELITGNEEARYTYLGVQYGCPALRGERLVCVDVGGGSCDVALGRGDHVTLTTTIPVGSLVVAKTMLGDDPIGRKTVARVRAHLRGLIGPRMAPFLDLGFDRVVGTSGTIQRLVRMAKAAHGLNWASRDVHGEHLPQADIDAMIERLARAGSLAERLRVPGVDPERADSLLGGALIFQALAHALSITDWTVSMAALRTGLIVDTHRRRTS